MPQCSGYLAYQRIHQNHGWKLSAAEYVVTYGPLLIDFQLYQSLVDSFVATSNQYQ